VLSHGSLRSFHGSILFFSSAGEKVILDADLAALYGVSTKRLKEQVRRNRERFPSDFMFELTVDEQAALGKHIAASNLRSQIATSRSHGGRRYLSYAFTEHGALMAANVLSSERAVRASVEVVRAFVRLRQVLASNAELARPGPGKSCEEQRAKDEG